MIKIIYEEKLNSSTPELKYYAFDWDDNIVHMPTKIILIDADGDEVKYYSDGVQRKVEK